MSAFSKKAACLSSGSPWSSQLILHWFFYIQGSCSLGFPITSCLFSFCSVPPQFCLLWGWTFQAIPVFSLTNQTWKTLCTIWEILPPVTLLFHKAISPEGNTGLVTYIRRPRTWQPQSQLWSLLVHIVFLEIHWLRLCPAFCVQKLKNFYQERNKARS